MASLSEEERARIQKRMGNRQKSGDGMMGRMGSSGSSNDMAQLWMLDNDGNVTMLPVEKGVSDGVNTQIIPIVDPRGNTPEIRTDMQIITDATGEVVKSEKNNGAKSLLPTSGRMGGGPPRGGGR